MLSFALLRGILGPHVKSLLGTFEPRIERVLGGKFVFLQEACGQ